MAVIVLIGVSRIFLAAHFPTDVLGGWLIGGVLLWAFLRWEQPVLDWFKRRPLGGRIGLTFAASLLLIGLPVLGLAISPAAVPPEWIRLASAAFPSDPPIDPRSMSGIVGVAGACFGLAAGVVLLFHQTPFEARTDGWKRIARFALGVVGVLMVWLGLRMVFPRDDSLVSQVLRYLRYALAGFWITYGAPWLFIRFRL